MTAPNSLGIAQKEQKKIFKQNYFLLETDQIDELNNFNEAFIKVIN